MKYLFMYKQNIVLFIDCNIKTQYIKDFGGKHYDFSQKNICYKSGMVAHQMFDIFKWGAFNHAEADYEQVRVGIGQTKREKVIVFCYIFIYLLHQKQM